MGQKNVRILHHQCEEIKFFGREMNFFIATPKDVAFQIQREVSDLDHAGYPRCLQARSPENLSHSCSELLRNVLRHLFGNGERTSSGSEDAY
jgi:hypothetical protein